MGYEDITVYRRPDGKFGRPPNPLTWKEFLIVVLIFGALVSGPFYAVSQLDFEEEGTSVPELHLFETKGGHLLHLTEDGLYDKNGNAEIILRVEEIDQFLEWLKQRRIEVKGLK